MTNKHEQYPLAISMMYTLSQLGNKKAEVLEGNREYLVTSGKFNDLGNEMVIPKQLSEDARYRYSGYSMGYSHETCKILEPYFAKKLEVLPSISNNYAESFKKRNGNILTFHDLHLCRMAAEYTERYLSYFDYGYEEYGFVELATLVAIELFKNYIENNNVTYGYEGYDPSKHPGGFYTFKEGFNVRDFIEDHIDDIDGIWQEEDEEDDDEDWD